MRKSVLIHLNKIQNGSLGKYNSNYATPISPKFNLYQLSWINLQKFITKATRKFNFSYFNLFLITHVLSIILFRFTVSHNLFPSYRFYISGSVPKTIKKSFYNFILSFTFIKSIINLIITLKLFLTNNIKTCEERNYFSWCIIQRHWPSLKQSFTNYKNIMLEN